MGDTGISVSGDAANGATVTQMGENGVLVKTLTDAHGGILQLSFACGCRPPKILRVEPWRHPSLEGIHFIKLMDKPQQATVSTAVQN